MNLSKVSISGDRNDFLRQARESLCPAKPLGATRCEVNHIPAEVSARLVDVMLPSRADWRAPGPPVWFDPHTKMFMDGPASDPYPRRTAFASVKEQNAIYLTDWQLYEEQVTTRLRRSMRTQRAKDRAFQSGRAYHSPEHTPEREMRELAHIAVWDEHRARPAPPPSLCQRLWNFVFG